MLLKIKMFVVKKKNSILEPRVPLNLGARERSPDGQMFVVLRGAA